MSSLDPTDYSVVVKHRAKPPNSWRWEIYCAGRRSAIAQSPVYFPTMTSANKAGKEALRLLLDFSHIDLIAQSKLDASV